ncbi:peptidase [Aureococcus anophagefferens]|nr:peptidase [Aureococcus anophagefferens]
MLSVPYFEKALYEMADEDLTAASVAALADAVEEDIEGGLGPRPLLSVPHLLSDEASCYYHGYVLAEMAVHQTRAFVEKRDGFLVDNPKIGPTLTDAFWRPGNTEPFLDLVEQCTGAPLSGDAWVAALGVPLDELLASEKAAYDAARRRRVRRASTGGPGHACASSTTTRSRGHGRLELPRARRVQARAEAPGA